MSEGEIMLANYHTHSTFSDGKDTLEQIVLAALEKGFCAIGFSEHGYAEYDQGCSIKDLDGYIGEITRLKKKYKNDIQIYLGIEEDACSSVDRSRFDYLIGSMHYMPYHGKYYPLDASREKLLECVDCFYGDPLWLAENYYRTFCDYILLRKPDIVGHFDLITKFDEKDVPVFLGDHRYQRIAEKYLSEVVKCDCYFEVNTGAIGRGYRTTPYPAENLLQILYQYDARIILSSDSHSVQTLDQSFGETKAYLKDIGFRHAYALYNDEFTKYEL